MPRPRDCDPSERLHDIARQTIAHPATSPRMANASVSKRAFMIATMRLSTFQVGRGLARQGDEHCSGTPMAREFKLYPVRNCGR